jgi:hypothetical protein
VEEALRWAANMKWKGFTPIVELVETVYQKGVKLFADELAPFSEQWQRAEALPKLGYLNCSYLNGILFICGSLRARRDL